MNKKNQKFQVTRRGFIKNLSASIAGATVIPPILKSGAKNFSGELKDSLEGKVELILRVNGKNIKKKIFPTITLAEFLRENLELRGTKIACNRGECGACTVILDGQAVYSCHLLALDAKGKSVITIEGLSGNGNPSAIQKAFIHKDGLQCGFCTPGQIMAASALLMNSPNPSEQEIKEAMSGNLCRCAAYPKIIESVSAASEILSNKGN